MRERLDIYDLYKICFIFYLCFGCDCGDSMFFVFFYGIFCLGGVLLRLIGFYFCKVIGVRVVLNVINFKVIDGFVDKISLIFFLRVLEKVEIFKFFMEFMNLVLLGGGEKVIERYIKWNKKFFVWERFGKFLDEGIEFLELL